MNQIRSRKQILRNAFPEGLSGNGIFSRMLNVPWFETGALMDRQYFASHSGDKFCANIVYNFMDDTGVVTGGNAQMLAGIIRNRFYQSWLHLWNVYTADYNPLVDYEYQEHHARNEQFDHGKMISRYVENTGDTVRTDDLTETDTNTRTDNLANSQSENSTDSVYGYNSASPVPSNVSTTTRQGTDTGTVQNNGTVKNTGTQESTSTESEQEQITNSGTDNTDSREDVTKSGIVNRTFQQLLSDERALWLWDFYGQIFKDVDSMIALKISEPKLIRREVLYVL